MNFQPDTTIYLCATDIMLGNGNTILFATKEEQTSYFLSKKQYEYDEQTYQRVSGGICYLDINVETINTGVNYMMFQNKNYSNKWFYANILKLSYVNPNTTRIDYAIDSFQSFMFDITYHESYIDRRHYSFKNDGIDKIMTLPYEDLDVGSQYVMCDINNLDLDTPPKTLPTGSEKYNFYFICTTKPFGTLGQYSQCTNRNTFNYINQVGEAKTYSMSNAIMSGLCYYVINGNMWKYLVGWYQSSVAYTGTLQYCSRIPFGEMLLKTDDKQTYNRCKQVSATLDTDEYRLFETDAFTDLSQYFANVFCHYKLEQYINASVDNKNVTDMTGYFVDNITSSIKLYLMRYPYTVVEMNDYKSNIISYKIQDFNNGFPSDILLSIRHAFSLQLYASLGSTISFVYQLCGYKNTRSLKNDEWLLENNLNSLLGGSFNVVNGDLSIPIVSDYQNAFLQANQNQINAQRTNASASLGVTMNNANASLQTGQLGANLSYQNAQIGADTQMANAQIQGSTALTNAGLSFENAMGSVVNNGINSALNVASNLFMGNGLGALSSGISGASGAITSGLQANNNYAMSQNSVNAMMNTSSNSANASMLQAQNALTASQANLNTNYANTLRNANLNYQSTIRTINSRIEDISNMPDTVQSMGSGSMFNTLYDRSSITCTTKTLPYNVLQRVSNYFTLYGFKSNSFENIKTVIDYFTSGLFIKTVNANISANIPQENLREIISMFDNGITLWKGADNYLNYTALRKE